MAVLGNTFFETRVEHLFDLARLVEEIFAAGNLPAYNAAEREPQ